MNYSECYNGACMPAKLFQSCPTLCQTPLSMGLSRQEYWSRLPFPSAGDLPDSGIKPVSPTSTALAGRFFTTSSTWEAHGGVLLGKVGGQRLRPLFMALLGLCCCSRAFSSCGAQASHWSGFSSRRAQAPGTWALVVVAHALSNCGSWA